MISVKDKEINSGPWKNISIDSQASLLHPLPLPLGGLVAVGYQTIAYYNKDVQHAIDPPIVKVHNFILYSICCRGFSVYSNRTHKLRKNYNFNFCAFFVDYDRHSLH